MRMPRQQHNDDLERELAHHLAELTDEYVRQGHTPKEARRMAKQQFGTEAPIKDQCQDESPWAWLQSILQDIQFGLRQLRQAPVVTTAAVLSLALGIGANSAIISLIDTVLWRSLPVPAPQQLSFIHWQGPDFPNHLSWRRRKHVQGRSSASCGFLFDAGNRQYAEGDGRVRDHFRV